MLFFKGDYSLCTNAPCRHDSICTLLFHLFFNRFCGSDSAKNEADDDKDPEAESATQNVYPQQVSFFLFRWKGRLKRVGCNLIIRWLSILVPEFEGEISAIYLRMLDCQENLSGEAHFEYIETILGLGQIQTIRCSIGLTNGKANFCTFRPLNEPHLNLVVNASIDREHYVMIADVLILQLISIDPVNLCIGLSS